jgi:hypothetical protein
MQFQIFSRNSSDAISIIMFCIILHVQLFNDFLQHPSHASATARGSDRRLHDALLDRQREEAEVDRHQVRTSAGREPTTSSLDSIDH